MPRILLLANGCSGAGPKRYRPTTAATTTTAAADTNAGRHMPDHMGRTREAGLGALAKSTGGVGLRSAIKVVQDVLVEQKDRENAVADNQIGWLATTVALYDALEKDIKTAFPPIYQSIDKALIRFTDSDIHKNVAKTIGVLQILGN